MVCGPGLGHQAMGPTDPGESPSGALADPGPTQLIKRVLGGSDGLDVGEGRRKRGHPATPC